RSVAKVPESPYTPEILVSDDMPDQKTVSAGRQNALMLGPGTWKDRSLSYVVQTGKTPFGSTYERIAGGTSMHWLGTSLRLLPSDFKMTSFAQGAPGASAPQWVDWPITYTELEKAYGEAEEELGVSGDANEQSFHKL